MKSKTLTDFFNYALGDVFVKGFLFISLPLLSRLLDPIQYGYLSLINTATIILYVFISLNLQNAITNRYMITNENFDSYLLSILYFIIPFQTILLILEPLYRIPVSSFLGVNEKDFFSILLICVMLSYIYIYTCYLQASRQSKRYVIFNIIAKISEITLIFVFAYFLTSNKYMSKIYAQMIVNIILIVYVLRVLWKLSRGEFKFLYLKEALIFSLPLIVHVLSNSLLAQADRLIINKLMGIYSAGIYSFAYNLGMCVIVVIMAWNSSWQPKLYKLINSKDNDLIKRATYASTVLMFLVCAITMLLSKEMVIFLSGEKYYDSVPILPLIIIGNSLIHMYLVYVNFVFYKKKTMIISSATLGALAINIVLNYYLIPIFGIAGSAWATVIAYFFLAALHYVTATFITKNNIIPFKYLIFYSAGLLFVYPMVLYLNEQSLVVGLAIKTIIMIIVITFIVKSKILLLLSE
ncbi:oligosaccharide flippase family protein [Yersinia pekkanenii]|uniref:Polysaccharide biosynthesis protein n=1 Tax=Yersinia pekkanenii TaxID=1288385 RepID=A0A0T9NIM6_9GAMM|nr:oligosaccharide flippase family protein [Yersinia pekkanenii]CNH13117.1 Polysaccharide biosynthesis protein [Yersinia pekkanenii]CRY65436.1 Polysaccharide biosynthesis protein [Yersinia pekkanenii]